MKKSRVIQIIREEIEKVVNEDKVQSTFNSIKDEGLLDDRGEYDVEDLESTYQLSSEDAKKLFTLIQNSTGSSGATISHSRTTCAVAPSSENRLSETRPGRSSFRPGLHY